MSLPPLQDLLDLLIDNVSGDITGADMQTIVTALYNGIGSGGGGGGGAARVGDLIFRPDTAVPVGALYCNGQAVSRTTYAALFAIIGITYGAGDAVTTFNLPDYRGYFLRVQNDGATIDPDTATRTNRGDGTIGDNVGTKQGDQVKQHSHVIRVNTNVGGLVGDVMGRGGTPKEDAATQNFGGSETRGKNIYVRMYIQAEVAATTFTSGLIALTAGSKAITPVAHGLSAQPNELRGYLLCNILDLGYAPSTRIQLAGLRWDGALNNGIELSADSTNIAPIQINGIKVVHKTTFVLTEITYANWSLVLQADP